MESQSHTSAADLNEKIVAARRYGHAQQALLEAIVEERAEHVIRHGLDVVRICGAMFNGTNPDATRFAEELSPRSITDTAAFLGLYTVIRQTDKLLGEWLQTANVGPVDRIFGLDVDPRNDVIVVAGAEASGVTAELQHRGYARVLRWEAMCQDAAPTEGDPIRIDAAFESIADLAVCRPSKVWLLWREGATCPDTVRAVLDDRLRRALMNRHTVASLGDRWARQFVQNLPAIARRGRDLGQLRGAFAGRGAVIVGAGPSLDGSIEWLRQQSTRPLIIASHKAAKALLRAGIDPDFIVMLDPKQGARHLAGCDLSRVAAFITEVAVDPQVLDHGDLPLLPYCSGEETLGLVSAVGDLRIPLVRSGGSVLHIALQFARLVGCERISLVGADFGFPGERLYAGGAGEGDTLELSSDRRTYVRRALDGNSRAGLLIGALANDGSVIPTTIELDHYRSWAEQMFVEWRRDCPQLEVFNLSNVGAQLAGAVWVADPTQHVASAESVDSLTVMQSIAAFMAKRDEERALASRLRTKVRKLRALGQSCARAASSARSGCAHDLRAYAEVAEHAVECPEVSLVLTRRLQVIDEQSQRSTIDAPQRLLELAEATGEQADSVASLYAAAARSLSKKSSGRVVARGN
ncbi:MAG: 6-hydroxymethylpterin diphosphokinase MptE-like protein [Nevskiaceae bacterium]